MVIEAAKKLNFFPAEYGVSNYYNPRMILHQQNLEYEKHCKFALGVYGQGHNEPLHKTTTVARSFICIYLRYNASTQGDHELLNLQTNKVVVRRHITPVLISPAIIRQINNIANDEGMTKGFKIINRSGNVFFDSALIAGVAYDDEEDFDVEFYEQEKNSNYTEDNDLNQDICDIIDPNELLDIIPHYTVDNEENNENKDEEKNVVIEENASAGTNNEDHASIDNI